LRKVGWGYYNLNIVILSEAKNLLFSMG
jgi:hypothetical protein